MSYVDIIREPTPDECNNRKKVYETDSDVGYACWYPQMGGYSGKAVAVFYKDDNENYNFDDNTTKRSYEGCIDVLVWHDGEFPFHQGENPVELHHCSAKQFIKFGEFLSNQGRESFKEKYLLK